MIEKAQKHYKKKNYKKAIFYASNIKSKNAYFILAESYFALKEYKYAIPYYTSLLKNNIKDPWFANHLSQCYEAMGDYKKAIELAFVAIELNPLDSSHHINLAYLLYEKKDTSALLKWQKKYGSNPLVSHFSSSILGDTKKTDSNIDYIKEIFDNFSSSFDNVLSSLSYQAPLYISKVLSAIKLNKTNILDLGCGTGLCGRLIKKYAKRKGLFGLDVSAKMLDEAYKKNIYNHLIEDDLNSFLSSNSKPFGCIVAADVLTYFGSLEDVFSNVSGNLDPNGYFVFSISKNNEDSKDIFLHSSGRFLHSKNYIKNLLKNNKMNLISCQEKVLRLEAEVPVIGFIICAQKKL